MTEMCNAEEYRPPPGEVALRALKDARSSSAFVAEVLDQLVEENRVLRRVAARPWWWHLGCDVTALLERVTESALRRLDRAAR